MTEGSSRPVAISLRLYRALAGAFPHEFKNVYGEELLQVTEEAIEAIWRRHGTPGLARLLADLAIRVPAEHLAEVRRDIRYGFRMLRASPGFTTVAVLSLALGICVATSAFSELNGLILRDLPGVAKPDELVVLETPSSYPAYRRYRERTDLFSSTLAYAAPVPFLVSLGGRSERIWGHLVTPSYFPMLGQHPALGRFFEEAYEQPGRPAAVVVSYRFWSNYLGADPSIVGRTLRVNAHPCVVVGVGSRDFLGASPAMLVADLWMPISVGGEVAPELAGNAVERHDLAMFHVLGRLRADVTIERAEAALDAVARQLKQDYGDLDRTDKGRRIRLRQGGKSLPIRKQDMPYFTAFFGVLAGLVVLIACANVANMMLARAADRRREIAVRLALGASRARLVRQLLAESMLVAAGAGMIGFLLSVWLMHGASQIRLPYPIPVAYDLRPDMRALLFTLVLTALTGAGFGLVPALQATATDLTPALKEGGAVRLRRYRRLSLRNLLVVHQVAGSLTLLLLTAFLVTDMRNRMATEMGFDPKRLYVLSLDPVRDGYSRDQAAAFFEKLLDRVKSLPSVTAAGLTDTVPVAMNGNLTLNVSAAGAAAGKPAATHSAKKFVVGREYFETTGLPILLGRAFRKEDEANERRRVIVSEGLAGALWPGQDPLGRRVEIDNQEAVGAQGVVPVVFDYRPGISGKRSMFEVVGVTRDVKAEPLARKTFPVVYFPMRPADYAAPSIQGVTLLVRAAPGVDAIGAVRREISAMDARITTFSARSMEEQIEQFAAVLYIGSSIYGTIGIFGLILASVGLAGVTAYSVVQRRREIGIRMALGARHADVLGLVMKEGAFLVIVGTAIGMAGAWAGNRLLAAIFFTIASLSGMSASAMLMAGAPVLLVAVALAACYLPARKSVRIDPAVALRQE